MRRLVFDAGGNAVAVEEFSDEVGGVVSIAPNTASDGLYYISWTTQITRLDYAPGGNFAPEAVLTADKLSGPAPLTIQFDGSNSTDPELQPLTYSWDFGDGAAWQQIQRALLFHPTTRRRLQPSYRRPMAQVFRSIQTRFTILPPTSGMQNTLKAN